MKYRYRNTNMMFQYFDSYKSLKRNFKYGKVGQLGILLSSTYIIFECSILSFFLSFLKVILTTSKEWSSQVNSLHIFIIAVRFKISKCKDCLALIILIFAIGSTIGLPQLQLSKIHWIQ